MAKLNILHALYFFFLMTFVSACSTHTGRYQQQHDSTPTRLPNASELHDATPRAEAPSRGGNKNYQVHGKHYQVLKSAKNFSQTGVASWYGRKFHGHLTSNGEIYDMYAMSAAHKSLPLPSYVKVVNNNNGRSVIVRVNDRGPFHQNRIIDLSFSAAYKLDMLKTGTANVTITAITNFNDNGLAFHQGSTNGFITRSTTTTPLAKAQAAVKVQHTTSQGAAVPPKKRSLSLKPPTTGRFIQVFASESNNHAAKLAGKLTMQYQVNTQLEQINGIFRVLVGPIERSDELTTLLSTLKGNGHPKAFIRQ
jgi:rare lipoprotein A